MRKHLSNSENYYYFDLEIEEISAFYPDESEWFKNVECSDDIDITGLDCVYLHCKVNHIEADGLFEHFIDRSLRFEIIKPNVEELLETDFFDVIGIGTKVSIKTSIWTYMDGDFNYIAEVKVDDQMYLRFDVGLQNIVDYMNANKGI